MILTCNSPKSLALCTRRTLSAYTSSRYIPAPSVMRGSRSRIFERIDTDGHRPRSRSFDERDSYHRYRSHGTQQEHQFPAISSSRAGRGRGRVEGRESPRTGGEGPSTSSDGSTIFALSKWSTIPSRSYDTYQRWWTGCSFEGVLNICIFSERCCRFRSSELFSRQASQASPSKTCVFFERVVLL